MNLKEFGSGAIDAFEKLAQDAGFDLSEVLMRKVLCHKDPPCIKVKTQRKTVKKPHSSWRVFRKKSQWEKYNQIWPCVFKGPTHSPPVALADHEKRFYLQLLEELKEENMGVALVRTKPSLKVLWREKRSKSQLAIDHSIMRVLGRLQEIFEAEDQTMRKQQEEEENTKKYKEAEVSLNQQKEPEEEKTTGHLSPFQNGEDQKRAKGGHEKSQMGLTHEKTEKILKKEEEKELLSKRNRNQLSIDSSGPAGTSQNQKSKARISNKPGILSKEPFLPSISSLKSQGQYLGTGLDLVSLEEPCVMCSMALVHSRIRRLVFSESTPSPLQGGILDLRIHLNRKLNHNFEAFCLRIEKHQKN